MAERINRTEVLIIGGGIIGCSIAYYLSKAGVKCIVVERDNIASGASGACDGFIFLQSKACGIQLDMAMQSAVLYKGLSEELDGDLEYRECGGMIVAESWEEMDYLANMADNKKKSGLKTEILTMDHARSKLPDLTDRIEGAIYCSSEAQINPIKATLAFADAAKRLGASILTDTSVNEFKIIKADKMKVIDRVVTNEGEIEAEIIINAAGAYTPILAETIKIDIPIEPRRGQILVTETLPKVINCLLMNARYIGAKICDKDSNTENRGVTFEQTKSGNLLIGSTREFVGYNNRTSYEGMTSIADNAVRMFPEFAEFKVIRSFAGLRPHTPDNLPILGLVSGFKNHIIASGHGGDGIALAPITGRLVTELIVEGKTSIDINALNPGRFQIS